MKQYVVDAFTKNVFHGNPAAVCVLEGWLPEERMQQIATENSLSETAFVVKEGDRYHIRWFTPGTEVDLCGHATLASAFVLTRFFDTQAEELTFISLSGRLKVRKRGEMLELDFPARMPRSIPFTEEMGRILHGQRAQAYVDSNLILVLEEERMVRDFVPDYTLISALEGDLGLFITAPSETYDFVSRTFFPKIKINEDPVCGSAHCNLIPYWSRRLNKPTLVAFQASPRGGVLYCEDRGDRVRISGHAALYSEAELHV
ncbi:MAG: PhzF family phenazine biosynthesis protein [Clostridia bacterium]|nr:PhzF family phenazine biosynthesis protein [Clostridia bacterium]MBQ3652021.1 PhzF family phenazine biosynthesis protein [Clostridia bacterium]MBQ6865829.1 PhzF family phenazine biosynthesis protein [Clostridia bacterium]MBQ9323736.1 PhzF family phenazine biosynthesis protein [Clostridia bacterium]MBR0423012.1 PhzF family phenazine biosynthesis protein [Clostridia bacterium]